MAEPKQNYLTTKTWTRAEWNAVQSGQQTEGGFVPYAAIKTSYEEYLKNAGFKDEAAAMAKRAEEDAAGTKFGEFQSEATKAFLAERKITPEYAAELDAAQARARAEDSKRIALLSKGYITGQEAVYIPGTPEYNKFMTDQLTTGRAPVQPDPYLDAQAFAARYDLYNRYGATTPTVTTWDDAKKQYVTGPNPFYNAEVLVPQVGMGTRWDALERAKWSTVVPGVGSTAATETAQLAMESYFQSTAGGSPAGMRFFMRTPGDITMATPTPVAPKKTRVSAAFDANGNFVINYSDGSKQVTDKNGVITTTSSDGTIIPNDTTVDGFGNAAGFMLGSGTKTVTSKTTDGGGNTTTVFSDGSRTVTDASGTLLESSGATGTLGSSTGKTGFEVFKNTLSLYFNAAEMNKPWVSQLYKTITGYTKTGSSGEEAFNMAVLESENKPDMADFVKRFKGIYALQKMKQEGKAVTVPTVAEYFATEAKMGDILKQSSLGDLANEDFLGDVLSKGVSATEFGNRIVGIFDRIDTAPTNIKNTISRFFPSVDRISLAKAIALGDKGAKELQAKIAGYEVLAAAEKQGVGAGQLIDGTTEQNAYQYALGGETYDTALTKFGTVAEVTPVVNRLTSYYNKPTIGQAGVESAVFGQSAADIKAMTDLGQREQASFSGRSGVSQVSLASQRRGAGLI
jgi:hypothetical protein